MKKLSNKFLAVAIAIFILVWTCFAFALPPSQYIMGGQDQGTYLNIAHQYHRQKALRYTDTFRISLTEDQRSIYDKYINYLMPSVELTDIDGSTFVMKFYPMHPFILSLFERLFGQNRAVIGLTFFSGIILISLSLLSWELSNRKGAALIATALVILINPLYTFFSRFPVGEITSVAFTSLGFYFLCRYIKRSENKSAPMYLIVSFLSFTGFFYTKMSSFMYMPLFVLFAFLSALYVEDRKKKLLVILYFAAIILSFGISYVFYYLFQPELFHLVYKSTVQTIFPSNSDIIISAGLLISAVIIFLVSKIRNPAYLEKIKKLITTGLKIFIVSVILISFYDTYLSFSHIILKHLPMTGNFERYWYLGTDPIQKIKHLNLYVIAEYLSPVGFILCFFAGFYYLKNFQKNIVKCCLFILIVWFYLINIKFGGVIRYAYYDTRYLFSESVVYMLVLIGIFLGDLIENSKTKSLGIILTTLIVACSLPFTLFQLNGPEGPHMDFYKDLTNKVTKHDLVLTATGHSIEKPQKYFDNFTTWSIAPLKFYYDLNVLILPEPSDVDAKPIKELAQRYEKTFLISDKPLEQYGANLITTRHRYSYYNVSEECSLHTYSFLPLESVKTMKIPKFLECLTPPNNYYTRYSNLYMYDITDSIKQ